MEKRKNEFGASAAKKVKFDNVEDEEEDLESMLSILKIGKKNNRKLKELGTESDESDAPIESDSDQEEDDDRKEGKEDDDMFGEAFEKRKKKTLERQDIEGQEWNQEQEDEEKFEPFNLEKEMEEGHFDEAGYYVRKKDELAIHDSWLNGITRKDMEKARDAQEKQNKKNNEYQEVKKDANQLWLEVVNLLKPKETLTLALKRLGGTKEPAWKKKKSKQNTVLYTVINFKDNVPRDVEKINQLTYLSDQLMSLGHFDIYDLNYEQIIDKLKQHGVVGNDWTPGKPIQAIQNGKTNNQASVFYEFKWGSEGDDIFGPYGSENMKSWQEQGYFDSGSSKAWIRQVRSGEYALQDSFKEYHSKMLF
jgi:CD2 antigen cytoplasmic tail-binding protein 2